MFTNPATISGSPFYSAMLNGGVTWSPLFDKQPVAAIGALSVFQQNPDIVWVGTGEGNVRNSASVGNGIYKSVDAGANWIHLGLEKTERIHRIVLHGRLLSTGLTVNARTSVRP